MITKKDFKIDYSIANTYIFIKKISLNLKNNTLLVQNMNNNNKYILKIGRYEDIFPEVYITFELIKNKLSSNIQKLYNYGKVDSTFKKFKLKNTKDLYFIVIEYISLTTLKDTIIYQLVDIYRIKQLLIQFLKFYSNANKKIGFIHWNIKLDKLLLNNNKTRLILTDLGFSITSKYNSQKSFVNQIRTMGYQIEKFGKKQLFILKKSKLAQNKNKSQIVPNRSHKYYKNIDSANSSIYKIKYNTLGNFDIINILRFINTTERILNEIPKQITLNNTQVNFFNSKLSLGDKIDYLLKFSYFKSYN